VRSGESSPDSGPFGDCGKSSSHRVERTKKKPAKQLPNLITISGGRREKSFRYNSEGLKNGKLIFLFFPSASKKPFVFD
jgi:hypothetical protein